MRSRAAAAKAGMCSAWQTWQTLSAPPLCWWTKAPPPAKYRSAMHPKIASARLAVSKFAGCMGLGLHTLVYTLDGQGDVLVALIAALGKLTPQRILPKLRLTKYMRPGSPRIAIFALLLAAVFLGAQFHSCADLRAAPASSHFCPVCSTTMSAMASEALSLVIAPVSGRLESPGTRLALSTDIPPAISPRAPPTPHGIR